MRPLPRRRRHAEEQAEDNTEPTTRLKRRCAGGAVVAGTAYLAVLATAAIRPTALRQAVTYGLLVGFGTIAALCALGALLAAAETRRGCSAGVSARREVDDIDWAIRFGAQIAEAFPDYEVRSTAPRGPSIR